MPGYRKLRRIASGESTELWYASSASGPVALKVLRSHDEEAEQHFKQEVQLLATLRHPAIVRLLDTGRDENGAPFAALEWIDGAEWGALRRGGAGHVSVAVAIASALEVVHRAGVVHRDVTPGNVLVGFDGSSYLVDFGIAHCSGGTITHAPVTRGTPGFMAPEQLDGMILDGRSDVFSLACCLSLTLGNASPWAGETPEAIARSVRERSPALPPSLDPELGACLRRCLSKAPSARLDAAAFGAFLRAHAGGPAAVLALFG